MPTGREIRVEQAPVDPAFNNPIFGMQATGGSTSVRGHWEPMRKAGAAARAMLIAAAAETWKADAADCRTEKGMVIHKSGKKLSYGQLAATAAKLPVPAEVKLKDPKDFRILGKSGEAPGHAGQGQRQGEVRPGRAPAGHAHRGDGALAGARRQGRVGQRHARPRRSRACGRWCRSRAASRCSPTATGPAKQGRDALEIKWDDGANATLSSEGISKTLSAERCQAGGAVGRNEGDVERRRGGEAARSRLRSAVSRARLHGADELHRLGASRTASKSGPARSRRDRRRASSAQVAGVAPGKVKVNTMYLGGGFGRRFAPDFAIDATLLSKMCGKPVKLVYTREDDMQGLLLPSGLGHALRRRARRGGQAGARSRAQRRLALDHGGLGLHEAAAGRRGRFGGRGRARLPLRHSQPARRVCAPGARRRAGLVLALGRAFAEQLLHRELHRRNGGRRGQGPVRVPPRAARASSRATRACSSSPRKRPAGAAPLPAGVHRGIAVVQSFGS